MGNRTAKFISALFASVLAGAPLSAVSQNAASAPAAQSASTTDDDDCLGSPKATAPQGHHWYYRLERGTKRQCWYLREEGAKVSQSTSAQTSAAQTSAAQNAPSSAPAPKTATPAPRSVQDARAEFTTQEPAPAPDTTASIPAPAAAVTPPPANPRPNVAADSSAQEPAIAARWPDTSNAAPAPQVAPATVVAEAQPAQQPAASDVPSGKPTGSLQTLLLVIGGALALAGITASFIYRFAGSKARAQASERRRRVNWEQPADNAHAPWAGAAGAGALSPRAERPLRTERPRPVDFGIALTAAANGRSPTEMRSGHLEIKTTEPEDVAPEYDDIEIETAAVDEQLETIDGHVDETADPDADAVDISAITAILELLAKEGPRLSEPNSEAGFADFAQTRRGQSAARA
jgi:hypothetical protein